MICGKRTREKQYSKNKEYRLRPLRLRGHIKLNKFASDLQHEYTMEVKYSFSEAKERTRTYR
jgi:hypothetical protein